MKEIDDHATIQEYEVLAVSQPYIDVVLVWLDAWVRMYFHTYGGIFVTSLMACASS